MGTIKFVAKLLPLAAVLLGCGGTPSAPKSDEVFYLHGGGVIDKDRSWEVYFPKLDREKTATLPRYVGVGVLEGDVRMARPIDWTIRDASYNPEKRFISYQSPRQFTFSIFERVEPDREIWPDVMKRYEKETIEQGATFHALRQPVGTANSQGRAYLLKTSIRAKPSNFDAYSTEILVRSDLRVLLVQITHRGHIDPIGDEVAQALASMVVY